MIVVFVVVGMLLLLGFVGKIWILKSILDSEKVMLFWFIYILFSLVLLVVILCVGISFFWDYKYKDSEVIEGVKVYFL